MIHWIGNVLRYRGNLLHRDAMAKGGILGLDTNDPKKLNEALNILRQQHPDLQVLFQEAQIMFKLAIQFDPFDYKSEVLMLRIHMIFAENLYYSMLHRFQDREKMVYPFYW
jgi:hypothetical protein